MNLTAVVTPLEEQLRAVRLLSPHFKSPVIT